MPLPGAPDGDERTGQHRAARAPGAETQTRGDEQRQRRVEQRRQGAGTRPVHGKDHPADAGDRAEEDGRLDRPAQRQRAAVAKALDGGQDDRTSVMDASMFEKTRARQIVQ